MPLALRTVRSVNLDVLSTVHNQLKDNKIFPMLDDNMSPFKHVIYNISNVIMLLCQI